MEVEIFFSDLTPTAQAEVLEAFNITDPKEMNWDVFALATIVTGD